MKRLQHNLHKGVLGGQSVVGTQSHLDYVRVGKLSTGVKVVAFVQRNVLDWTWVLSSWSNFLYVKVGEVLIGGVYGRGRRSANQVR